MRAVVITAPGGLEVLELRDVVTAAAAALVSRHPLRAADALHLASALQLRSPDLVVAAWDDHLVAAAAAAAPAPNTPDGCEECLRDGTSWVHLRLCLACGHVGCCDSSPHRHATAHFHESEHPVMRSFELGEAWRWCFVDDQLG